jgi:multidrug efflux system membrane fusion protein
MSFSAQPSTSLARAPGYIEGLGAVVADTVTVRSRVGGQLISVGFKEGAAVTAGQVLASIDSRLYEVELARAVGQLAEDRAQLDQARNRQDVKSKHQIEGRAASVAQLEGRVEADSANVEKAKLQLSYTRVVAPIAGVAGLLLVEPGNIVQADATGIVTITPVRPIAIVFAIPEDELPALLAAVRSGSSLRVEAWNRGNNVRLATGRLVAVDNQIEPAIGTVKLKAVFENNDDALFPNEFVNVRLFVAAR